MTLATGSQLGPYEVLGQLGAGGMGEVYRARDPRLGREVAIKVLPEAMSRDPDRLRRFEQEARSASALNHPNIVTVHEIGSVGGTAYIAMELVEGASLREMLASGPLSTKRLLDVAVQIAEALGKAHSAGIVHRDLKPENVIVSKDGYVKLLDFGLAKLFAAPGEHATGAPTIAQETEPGTVMGTVGYMSPEQASGQPVDFHSDQFSLGSILYEMATGRRPFQRKTGVETLSAIIRDEPEPVASVNPRAPAPFRWIVERCLAKEPDERYASTRDLARELESVREHIGEVTSTASGGTAAATLRRRSRLLPLAAAAIVAAAGFFEAGRRTASASRQPTFQRLTFQRGTVASARFGPDGQTVYYTASWEGQRPRVYTLQPGVVESSELPIPSASLLGISAGGDLAILLDTMIAASGFILSGTLARAPLTGGTPKELLQDVTQADWAPGASGLAVVHHVSGKDRLEFPIGKVLFETAGWIQNPRFSADGRRIAFLHHPNNADDGAVMLIDASGGAPSTLAAGFSTIQGLAWSADHREIWFTAARRGIEREIYAVSASGKLRLVRTMQGTPALLDLAGSNALLTEDDYRSGSVVFLPGEAAPRNLGWLDWSSDRSLSVDGKQFLFDESGEGGGQDGTVYLRPTDASSALRLGDGIGVALSPDASAALIRTVPEPSHFVVAPVRAGQPRELPPDGLGRPIYGAFFPDGSRFVFEGTAPGHGARLYVQSVGGGPPAAVSPEGINFGRVFVSPDSRWIAATGPDRNVHLYPAAGGEPREVPGIHPGELASGWSADGRGLYVSAVAVPCPVDLIDVESGARTHVRDLVGSDAAGILSFGPARVTPDGRTMSVTFIRILSTLYRIGDVR